MLLATGRAPGKIILCGEHAVVYGRPALAVPVEQVQAVATVESAEPGAGVLLAADDLGEVVSLAPDDAGHPLAVITRLTLAHLGLPVPDWRVRVRSTVPIASGLGSGAAVSAAIAKALAAAAGRDLSPAEVSDLVYETEKIHHGTPSGIDNTVIAYDRPVYFRRDQLPAPFAIRRPFSLVIADSGIPSPTRVAVGDLRRAWQEDPERIEALFDRVEQIVEAVRAALAAGRPGELGPMLDANQEILGTLGVSCPELDRLVAAARAAGAAGAKLSGGGRGGNLIALVTDETAADVAAALAEAGAVRTITTTVGT
ncbi:MAG TPA: mevalonate kinase [Anaerolineae bacterium]